MNFLNQTIWITGATSGIGKAVAIEISKHKANLILSGRNENALKETGEECKKNGSTIQHAPFDLGDENSVKQAAEKLLAENKTIHGLYHFGGISQRSFVSETPLEVDRKIFEINFFGTVLLTKFVLPSMLKNGGGHIAVTSSIVGKFGFPYRSAYSASKHALHGFFESLRAENVKNNIRVSVIIPGRIKTNISLNAVNSEGQKHGKMDKGQDKGVSTERAAKIMVQKLKKEKKEILIGGKEIIMVHIRRFLPGLYYKLAAKVRPL